MAAVFKTVGLHNSPEGSNPSLSAKNKNLKKQKSVIKRPPPPNGEGVLVAEIGELHNMFIIAR